jgi:hypothetical protein
MKARSIAICTMLALGLLSACSRKPADQAAATPPGASAVMAAHTASAGGQIASGTVLETMDAANYTYVRVKTASGEIWAAASTFNVKVGDEVVVPLENPMEKFHSPSLNRDFPIIYFASSITHAGEPAGAATGSASTGESAPPLIARVPPAPGGLTVADIWATRKALAGKTVTVRGRVVKFNGGILGLNWMHIQDGTGVVKDGTHDLTITSNAETRVDAVITVTGTVVLDKDFGAGYAYVVMLQNATVTVK